MRTEELQAALSDGETQQQNEASDGTKRLPKERAKKPRAALTARADFRRSILGRKMLAKGSRESAVFTNTM